MISCLFADASVVRTVELSSTMKWIILKSTDAIDILKSESKWLVKRCQNLIKKDLISSRSGNYSICNTWGENDLVKLWRRSLSRDRVWPFHNQDSITWKGLLHSLQQDIISATVSFSIFFELCSHWISILQAIRNRLRQTVFRNSTGNTLFRVGPKS